MRLRLIYTGEAFQPMCMCLSKPGMKNVKYLRFNKHLPVCNPHEVRTLVDDVNMIAPHKFPFS